MSDQSDQDHLDSAADRLTDEVENLDAAAEAKAQEAEAPLERTTSQDFEVGSTEEPYLGGGITADVAFAAKAEMVDKLDRETGAAALFQPNPEEATS